MLLVSHRGSAKDGREGGELQSPFTNKNAAPDRLTQLPHTPTGFLLPTRLCSPSPSYTDTPEPPLTLSMHKLSSLSLGGRPRLQTCSSCWVSGPQAPGMAMRSVLCLCPVCLCAPASRCGRNRPRFAPPTAVCLSRSCQTLLCGASTDLRSCVITAPRPATPSQVLHCS